MKRLTLIRMVPVVLIAGAAFAQDDNRAVPRGSGSSSSSAGERHTGGSSSSGSSASSSSGNRGGSSSAASGSEYMPAPDAASRRPRPGTGTGTRDRFGNDRDRYVGSPYSSYYYDPYYYSYFGYPGRSYGRLGYGYGYGYYDYGYGYGDYSGYYPSYYSRSYRYRSGNVAQLRTLVEPSKTRVYVDGYYAGTVDDFDGLLQRLNVSPGRHDITLRLEGYQSHTFSIYANREQTLKLRWDMVRGNGETRDTVGEEYARRSDPDDDDAREREMDRERERENADRGGEVDSERNDRTPMPREGRDGARGELALDIQPLDASVYVDGEFYGKASQLAHLELAAGRHRIEIVRPGYKTEETEVTVDGEPRKLVVKLERR
jgi:hypothetical protein